MHFLVVYTFYKTYHIFLLSFNYNHNNFGKAINIYKIKL